MNSRDRQIELSKTVASALVALIVLLCGGISHAQMSKDDQAKLIKKIQEKAFPVYDKYRGVWSRRQVTLKILEPGSGKLKETRQMTVEVQQFFYKPPVRKIISCAINGKKVAPAECKGKGKPKNVLPVFDRDGAKNYTVSVAGERKVLGKQCHRLRVVPRKKTDTRFWGDFYVDKETLEPVWMSGRLGSLPFPLKRFSLALGFGKHQGVPVTIRGRVDITIKVPVVYHARMVSRYRTLKSRLIPK